jgi:hypothetical protein
MKPRKQLFKGRRRQGVYRVEPTGPDRYDPDDPRYIAMHEAGHAVAAVVVGWELRSVDIKRCRLPDGTTSVGFTDTKSVNATEVMGKGEEAAMPHLIQCLAGPLAEMQVNDRFLEYDAHRDDRENARKIACFAVCNAIETERGLEIPTEEQERNKGRIDALISSATEAAARLVNGHVRAITRVAELLTERKKLSGKEVAAIVAEHPGRTA